MKLKKLLCMTLPFALVVGSVGMTSVAATEAPIGGETILFDESAYEGLTLKDAGAKKLQDSGYSQNLIEAMPEENLEKIGASPKAQQMISYYMEVPQADGTADLQPISESEYETELNEEMQARADAIAQSIEVVNENGETVYDPNNGQTPYVSESVDDGKLSVVTTLYQVQGGQLSQYLVVAEYLWTTPPDYRGADFFGITRDTNCSMIPGTFGNTTYYNEYRYRYLATMNGVFSSLDSVNEYEDSDLPNEDSAANGFVIKENLPVDINPPPSMLVGSSFLSRNYANMQGAVWYEGVLQTPSIYPQNFNHWGTYWHQKSTVWGTISISVPKGASFTVDPEAKYSNQVEDSILVTWDRVN